MAMFWWWHTKARLVLQSATADAIETMAEAQAHCTGQRREMYLVELVENKPPFVFGNFPRSEVRFMCLEPGDPRLARQQN